MSSALSAATASGTPVTVVVVNFNGIDCLPRTLASLKACTKPFAELIVVDDGSTDGSCEWVARHHPDIRLIRLDRNTANLGKVRNTGLRAAGTRHVFLTDNDIQLQHGAIERLLHTLTSDPMVFCVTPRLLDDRDPQIICQDGNGLHFLGVSSGSIRDRPVSKVGTPPPFPSFGGGIMMLDMLKVNELGLFDEGYVHGWSDDAELQIRGVLAGYKCLHDPSAVCLLEIKRHGTGRAYGQLHNRYRLLLTCYSTRTLCLLSPALIIFEVILMLGSLLGGFGSAYFRAWRATWRARHDIRRMRRVIQLSRKTPDRRIMRAGKFELPGGLRMRGPKLAIFLALHWLLDLNWWIATPLLQGGTLLCKSPGVEVPSG